MRGKASGKGVLMIRKQRTHSKAKEHEDLAACVALIFSNDRTFLDYYQKLFAELGFAPITANTCEVALGILRLTLVAFIIVDQGGKHLETRRVLECAHNTQRHAPALVISSKPDPQFRQEALQFGTVYYLDHPALPDDIVHALVTTNTSAQKDAPQSH